MALRDVNPFKVHHAKTSPVFFWPCHIKQGNSKSLGEHHIYNYVDLIRFHCLHRNF